MTVAGIGRVIVVSAAPAGPRGEQPKLERRLLMPILDRVFGQTYADMRRMEALLESSGVAWTSVRPPLLASTPTGRYRMSTEGPLPRGRSIRCGDLATALLDALNRPEYFRQAAAVAA